MALAVDANGASNSAATIATSEKRTATTLDADHERVVFKRVFELIQQVFELSTAARARRSRTVDELGDDVSELVMDVTEARRHWLEAVECRNEVVQRGDAAET